jgi:hypothetical protein
MDSEQIIKDTYKKYFFSIGYTDLVARNKKEYKFFLKISWIYSILFFIASSYYTPFGYTGAIMAVMFALPIFIGALDHQLTNWSKRRIYKHLSKYGLNPTWEYIYDIQKSKENN